LANLLALPDPGRKTEIGKDGGTLHTMVQTLEDLEKLPAIIAGTKPGLKDPERMNRETQALCR